MNIYVSYNAQVTNKQGDTRSRQWHLKSARFKIDDFLFFSPYWTEVYIKLNRQSIVYNV